MALVDLARYQVMTGDTTSSADDVEAAIAEATELLEDELRRPLESAERTERLRLYAGGRVYPNATPVTVANGYTIEGDQLVGATALDIWPWSVGSPSQPVYAEVTYTGGWTSATVPATIAREIARNAQRLLTHSAVLSDIPVGATSVQLGDAGVTFAGSGYEGGVSAGVSWSDAVLRYRKRFT